MAISQLVLSKYLCPCAYQSLSAPLLSCLPLPPFLLPKQARGQDVAAGESKKEGKPTGFFHKKES